MKIVLSVVLALLFIGCSEETQKETKAAVAPAAHKAVEKVAQAHAVVEEKVAQVKEIAHATADKAEEVVTKTVEKAQVVADSAVETTKAAADAVADKVEVALSSTNAKTLFAKCAGCHGQNAEKKALGKSQVIQGWSDAKIADALNGYAKGTYGGAMKGIMIGQAKGLSTADIQALAEYISTL